MITDEQLIQQIQTALGDEATRVHPPVDLLERLRAAPAPRSRHGLRAPFGLGGAASVIVSVAVVAIVVVVFASFGHVRSSSTSVSVVPAGTPAGARALVSRLALLRRPQTAADRLPASVIAQTSAPYGPHLHVIEGLTRLAATVRGVPGVHGPVQVFVVVLAKSRGYPVDLVTTLEVAGPPQDRRLLYDPLVVDVQDAIATGGLSASAVGSNLTAQGNSGLNVSVVPDIVARVKWVFAHRPPASTFAACRPAPGTRRARNARACIQSKLTWFAKAPRMTVYPTVHNNVAVSIATPQQAGLFSATWYAPDGRIVASVNTLAQQRAEQAQALAASARQPTAAALIEHFSIFRAPVSRPGAVKRLPRRDAVAIAGMGYGLNVAQARFVAYPGTAGLWVVPGASGISLMAPPGAGGGGGGGNDAVSRALSGRVSMSTCCTGGKERIWGLVPDGNHTVTVLLAGGQKRTLPVIDNVYSIATTRKVLVVITQDAGGRQVRFRAPG